MDGRPAARSYRGPLRAPREPNFLLDKLAGWRYAESMSKHYDQLLLDVFTTALEGGIGYWSECTRYHWLNGDTPDVQGFHAHIHDTGDDELQPEGTFYNIDRTVIDRGYRLGCQRRNDFFWQCETIIDPRAVDEDGWDHDAWDADMIVQLGLFGEIVYG